MDLRLDLEEGEGLFSKRSSSNILSDPRILQHLRIVAQEARQESLAEPPENDETDLENQQRELYDKITAYNKRNQLGAFKILTREVCYFRCSLLKATGSQPTGGVIFASQLVVAKPGDLNSELHCDLFKFAFFFAKNNNIFLSFIHRTRPYFQHKIVSQPANAAWQIINLATLISCA